MNEIDAIIEWVMMNLKSLEGSKNYPHTDEQKAGFMAAGVIKGLGALAGIEDRLNDVDYVTEEIINRVKGRQVH